ncbi:alpha/beta hydrolase [Nocardia goodfellowii]|uniref:S-formylglutathione hydrolase FrmB n=1 Tax=Nocardia goodfellowii TaxID=882446 RepID=A0ABS4Q730_9NOCA|nr:alpha/beta hydrolase family protein [Nocardia goodfellowii]MBP2187500.1 S-formylglutathione hydrolase FrmB [Nocardia goodfellowii]
MKRSVLNRVNLRRSMVAVLAAMVSVTAFGGTGVAEPAKAPAVTSVEKDGRTWHLKVYSAAMDKEVTIDVQRPVDESTPAPNLYLMSGLDAGESSASWREQTTVLPFLAEKHVNVIEPIGGRGSYYTDWVNADPVLGVNKWRTFFTSELPPLLDKTLQSTGRNALAGVSTSGTSVLQLAEAKPGLWKSVAAYSGCAQIADPLGRTALKLSVENWAGGNIDNMYGPADSPLWEDNDPVINAEKLRGTELYISTGSGIPVFADLQWYQTNAPGPVGMVNLTVGSVIEAAVDQCTRNLKNKLDSLNIPAQYDFNSIGTHRWSYWDDTFRDSWPMLARGMGLTP